MSVASPVIDYINPVTRRIYLLAGITEYHPVEDIYMEVRNIRRTDEDLRHYDVWVTAGGSLPKNEAGTERTPRYAIFHNSQVVLSGDTKITGEQLFEDSNGSLVGKGWDCIDRILSPANAYAEYAPPEAEIIAVDGGSGSCPTVPEIVGGLLNAQQSTYKTPGTIGASLNDISYTDKYIFVDCTLVTNGDGKSGSPFNNVSDAVDFAELVGWRKLLFLADATLERTLKNFTIEGIGLPVIDFNGQNVDKSEFFKVKLTGQQVGTVACREVVLLNNLTDMDGVYKESGLAGNLTCADNSNVTLASISSLFTTGVVPNTIDMGSENTNVLLNMRKVSGAILIKSCNTATKVATIEFSGGKIEIDNSNTNGVIGIAGIPDTAILNNANGTQVITVGVFPGASTIANAVLDEVSR